MVKINRTEEEEEKRKKEQANTYDELVQKRIRGVFTAVCEAIREEITIVIKKDPVMTACVKLITNDCFPHINGDWKKRILSQIMLNDIDALLDNNNVKKYGRRVLDRSINNAIDELMMETQPTSLKKGAFK